MEAISGLRTERDFRDSSSGSSELSELGESLRRLRCFLPFLRSRSCEDGFDPLSLGSLGSLPSSGGSPRPCEPSSGGRSWSPRFGFSPELPFSFGGKLGIGSELPAVSFAICDIGSSGPFRTVDTDIVGGTRLLPAKIASYRWSSTL